METSREGSGNESMGYVGYTLCILSQRIIFL